MPQSIETYRRLASDGGYGQVTLEKVVRLGEMLQEIYEDEWLGQVMVLRGGTALNLEAGRPPRLSVDLDFDYIGSIERERMLSDKPLVLDQLRAIGRQLGYQANLANDAASGSTLKFRYTNSIGTSDLVKVDVSWTNRVGIGFPRKVELWQPEGVRRPTVQIASQLDLIAGKFRALVDRSAARDVFDAVRIAESFAETGWPRLEIRTAFVFLSGTLPEPLTAYRAERIDRLSQAEAEDNLVPMLAASESLDFATLVSRAKAALEPMLNLTDEQLEFVRRLHEGQLRPDLIFPRETAERLARHPHLLWKVTNVKQHLAKGESQK